jgi:hypothetical protein
MTSH